MTGLISETFHFLDVSNGPQFAVVTNPTTSLTGTGVLLCSGGWFSGSWNFNRVFVNLARSLASQGHKVVRFDWCGTGESPGGLTRFDLTKPAVEDVLGAVSLLEGSKRIVCAGLCFGATSLLAASEEIANLEALVLIAAMVPGGRRDKTQQIRPAIAFRAALRPSVVKGWFNPYTRRLYLKWLRARRRALYRRIRGKSVKASEPTTMAIQLRKLQERGVSVWFLYGEEDPNLREFSGEPLATASAHAHIEVVSFDVGSSDTLGAQEEIRRVTARAVANLVASERAANPA